MIDLPQKTRIIFLITMKIMSRSTAESVKKQITKGEICRKRVERKRNTKRAVAAEEIDTCNCLCIHFSILKWPRVSLSRPQMIFHDPLTLLAVNEQSNKFHNNRQNKKRKSNAVFINEVEMSESCVEKWRRCIGCTWVRCPNIALCEWQLPNLCV